MFTPWYETDSDCHQHMRHNGTVYEMIQCVWLDMTEEDRAEGRHEYCVVRLSMDLNDCSDEEKESYLSAYDYTLQGITEEYGDEADSIIAECILEEDILCDSCVIAEADSFEEAKDIILKYMFKI